MQIAKKSRCRARDVLTTLSYAVPDKRNSRTSVRSDALSRDDRPPERYSSQLPTATAFGHRHYLFSSTGSLGTVSPTLRDYIPIDSD
jgi:hypothetical protein